MPPPLRSSPFALHLAACKHIFIDVGSNIGVQLQHLFEPGAKPGARMQHTFDKLFGTTVQERVQGVCAVAFEANPHHTVRLRQLERKYRALGAQLNVFTETAISNTGGTKTFHIMASAPQHHEWGSSLLARTTPPHPLPTLLPHFRYQPPQPRAHLATPPRCLPGPTWT